MNLPTPSVEYGLLSPMLIVFGAAIVGVLVEAFVSRERRYAAQVALSVVGLIADSLLFLWLAFGSLEFLEGQILGKLWMVLLALPVVHWIRRHETPSRIAES